MKRFKALTILVLSVFFFQNCMTIFQGNSQKIPVTSNPIGAKIFVDGEAWGNTPLNLKLKRKRDHVLRIEKQGYNPLEIRITRKTSAAFSVLGNMIWGFMGASLAGGKSFGALILFGGWFLPKDEWEEELRKTGNNMLLGFLIAWGGAILLDYVSGANYGLSPNELNVTLTKIEGKLQPNLILVDAETFQNVKWIRIKCDDSDGEDEIEIDDKDDIGGIG